MHSTTIMGKDSYCLQNCRNIFAVNLNRTPTN